MVKKKERNKNLLSSRHIYRMISQAEDVPIDVVQDILTTFMNIVYLATTEGYRVSIPKVGCFYGMYNRSHKKGERRAIPKNVFDNTGELTCLEGGYKVYQEGEKYYREYIKDQEEYRVPRMKFYRKYREKCRERSLEVDKVDGKGKQD